MEEPEKVSNDEAALIGALGRRSLHFFTVFPCKYHRFGVLGTFHGRMCQRVERIERPLFLLCYRGAFKSTVVKARMLWGAVHDPADFDAMMIVDDLDLGVQHLAEIGRQVSENELFQRVYPELQPKKGDWSSQSKSLAGRNPLRTGPTWELRTTGQSTSGRHRRLIAIEDLVSDANYRSRTKQEELKRGLDTMWPALNTDELLFTGSRYADYDYWGYLIQELYPQHLDILAQPVRGWAEIRPDGTLDLHDDKFYAHEAEWNDYRFEKERRKCTDPGFFASQYMLETRLKTELSFLLEWIKRVRLDQVPELTMYLAADPASGVGTSQPTIVAMGIGESTDIYAMEARNEFKSEAAFVEAIFEMAGRWHPVIVGIERFGQGGHGIWQQVISRGLELKQYLPLEALTGPRDQRKEDRIRQQLWPLYQWGKIYHLNSFMGSDYEDQLDAFPGGRYMDLVDAAARCSFLCKKYGYRGARGERKPKPRPDPFGIRVGLTMEQATDPGRSFREGDFKESPDG